MDTNALEQIEANLPNLNERLRAWREKTNREFRRYPISHPFGPEAAKVYRDYVYAKVGSEPLDEAFEVLDALGTIYLEATPVQRAEIRNLLGQNDELLLLIYSYMGRATDFLEQTADPKWLTLGLAAVSMSDRQLDFRDMLVTMGDLYVAAVYAGIKPGPYFKAVGEISNPSKKQEKIDKNFPHPILTRLWLGSGVSIKQTISNFERTAHFRFDVLPKLRKK